MFGYHFSTTHTPLFSSTSQRKSEPPPLKATHVNRIKMNTFCKSKRLQVEGTSSNACSISSFVLTNSTKNNPCVEQAERNEGT